MTKYPVYGGPLDGSKANPRKGTTSGSLEFGRVFPGGLRHMYQFTGESFVYLGAAAQTQVIVDEGNEPCEGK